MNDSREVYSMKQSKRILSIFLCAALLAGVAAIPASAADPAQHSPAMRVLYDIGDAALRGLATVLGLAIPADIPRRYEQSPDFYPGMERFITEPEGEKAWSLGYGSGTIIPEGWYDPDTGAYIGEKDPVNWDIGGVSIIGRGTPLRLVDDLRVRSVVLNDGSGRGSVAIAAIDGIGLTSYDVRAIRRQLRDFAQENGLVSINIAALHQHAAIDTLGLDMPVLRSVLLNPLISLLRVLGIRRFPLINGKHPAYMDSLYEATVQAIQDAVGDMKEGKLYYGAADAEKYIREKREPYVFDPDIHRLRFSPKDGSAETWLVNYSAHCTYMNTSEGISGDYPYYMEQAVNGAGANFMLVQGAQSAITYNGAAVWHEGMDRITEMAAYGHELGSLLIGIGNGDREVAPILNIRHREFRIPVDNPLHLVMIRIGMIESTTVRSHVVGPWFDIVTETAYMELGEDLAVAFGPGEVEACMLLGGSMPAEKAWSGRDYTFTPMVDMVGGRKLLMFGLINDYAGYFVLPNDIVNLVLFENEEINLPGKQAFELLLQAFEQAVKGE